ncbi:hypothetical protein BDN70DRAFT_900172 [Pholiota conissans]|uniref:Uncharacterized protein n=1 Tax=Pholiota conissans TaxID=109636 RepID=A0A9P5YNB9_9AGAR|nr:hypothetical protein BDN70DRAFT_900172 [Pholiota conissans]
MTIVALTRIVLTKPNVLRNDVRNYGKRDCQASEAAAKHASVAIAACLAVMGSCWDLGKRAKTARSIVIFLCSIANFAFKVSWNKLLTILKDMRKSSALNI